MVYALIRKIGDAAVSWHDGVVQRHRAKSRDKQRAEFISRFDHVLNEGHQDTSVKIGSILRSLYYSDDYHLYPFLVELFEPKSIAIAIKQAKFYLNGFRPYVVASGNTGAIAIAAVNSSQDGFDSYDLNNNIPEDELAALAANNGHFFLHSNTVWPDSVYLAIVKETSIKYGSLYDPPESVVQYMIDSNDPWFHSEANLTKERIMRFRFDGRTAYAGASIHCFFLSLEREFMPHGHPLWDGSTRQSYQCDKARAQELVDWIIISYSRRLGHESRSIIDDRIIQIDNEGTPEQEIFIYSNAHVYPDGEQIRLHLSKRVAATMPTLINIPVFAPEYDAMVHWYMH